MTKLRSRKNRSLVFLDDYEAEDAAGIKKNNRGAAEFSHVPGSVARSPQAGQNPRENHAEVTHLHWVRSRSEIPYTERYREPRFRGRCTGSTIPLREITAARTCVFTLCVSDAHAWQNPSPARACAVRMNSSITSFGGCARAAAITATAQSQLVAERGDTDNNATARKRRKTENACARSAGRGTPDKSAVFLGMPYNELVWTCVDDEDDCASVVTPIGSRDPATAMATVRTAKPTATNRTPRRLGKPYMRTSTTKREAQSTDPLTLCMRVENHTASIHDLNALALHAREHLSVRSTSSMPMSVLVAHVRSAHSSALHRKLSDTLLRHVFVCFVGERKLQCGYAADVHVAARPLHGVCKRWERVLRNTLDTVNTRQLVWTGHLFSCRACYGFLTDQVLEALRPGPEHPAPHIASSHPCLLTHHQQQRETDEKSAFRSGVLQRMLGASETTRAARVVVDVPCAFEVKCKYARYDSDEDQECYVGGRLPWCWEDRFVFGVRDSLDQLCQCYDAYAARCYARGETAAWAGGLGQQVRNSGTQRVPGTEVMSHVLINTHDLVLLLPGGPFLAKGPAPAQIGRDSSVLCRTWSSRGVFTIADLLVALQRFYSSRLLPLHMPQDVTTCALAVNFVHELDCVKLAHGYTRTVVRVHVQPLFERISTGSGEQSRKGSVVGSDRMVF